MGLKIDEKPKNLWDPHHSPIHFNHIFPMRKQPCWWLAQSQGPDSCPCQPRNSSHPAEVLCWTSSANELTEMSGHGINMVGFTNPERPSSNLYHNLDYKALLSISSILPYDIYIYIIPYKYSWSNLYHTPLWFKNSIPQLRGSNVHLEAAAFPTRKVWRFDQATLQANDMPFATAQPFQKRWWWHYSLTNSDRGEHERSILSSFMIS